MVQGDADAAGLLLYRLIRIYYPTAEVLQDLLQRAPAGSPVGPPDRMGHPVDALEWCVCALRDATDPPPGLLQLGMPVASKCWEQCYVTWGMAPTGVHPAAIPDGCRSLAQRGSSEPELLSTLIAAAAAAGKPWDLTVCISLHSWCTYNWAGK